MKMLLLSLTIVLGSLNELNAQFTNLDFESASWVAMPGWTVSCNIYGGATVPFLKPIGPAIGVYINGDYGTWTGGQGTYIVMLWGATIAQTGYLSPLTRSLHCRLTGSILVSFAGENLSCVPVSSNYECAADISKFAGSTGELKFEAATSSSGYLDSIWFSDQSVSNLPPTAPTIAVSEMSDSRVRLAFPAQLGTTYLVEATTNLLNWETVASFQATNNRADFFEALAASYKTRYYRVVVPP